MKEENRSGASVRRTPWILPAAMTLGVALAFATVNSCGKKANDPEAATSGEVDASHENYPYPYYRGQDFHGDSNFAVLINNFREGKPALPPWAGAWWAYRRQSGWYWGNGIAANIHGNATPAGKYDAAHCGKTHVQDWEVKFHGQEVKDAEGWWGHCNGWSTAAALFPEPREPVKVNGILFTVADLKAILTEASMLSTIDFFGSRMEKHHNLESREYNDVVPDMFFLVLTNYMGKLRQGVLIDQDTGPAVWNQPVVGYRFDEPRPADYLGTDPHAPHVHRMLVRSEVWWASDNVSDPGMLTPEFNFQRSFPFDSRRFKMEVWLDAPPVFEQGKLVSSGNVIVSRADELHHIGGAWKMEEFLTQPGYDWEHLWPDYMWIPYQIQKASGYPDNDREYYSNPGVDIDWVKAHLLVPGGADDVDYTGKPCEIPAPPPSPVPSPSPSVVPSPSPIPSASPSARPSGVT